MLLRILLPLLITILIARTSQAQLQFATIADIDKDDPSMSIGTIGSAGYFVWYASKGLGVDHTLNFYDAQLNSTGAISFSGDYALSELDDRDSLLCICLTKSTIGQFNLDVKIYNARGVERGSIYLEHEQLTTLSFTDDGIFFQSYDKKENKEIYRLYDLKFKEKWRKEETKTSTQNALQAMTYPFLEKKEWLIGSNEYQHEKGLHYSYTLRIKSINPKDGSANFTYTENTGTTYFVPLSIKKTAAGTYIVLGSYRVFKFPNTITPEESGIFKLVLNAHGEKMAMMQTKWSEFLPKVFAVSRDPDDDEVKHIYRKTVYGTSTGATQYFGGSSITEAMVWKDQYGFFAYGGNEFFMIYTDEDLKINTVRNVRSDKADSGDPWIGFFACGPDRLLPDQMVYLAIKDKRQVGMFFVNLDPDNFHTSSFKDLVFEDKFDHIVYNPDAHTSNIDIVHSFDCDKFLVVNSQISGMQKVRIYLYNK